MPWDVPTCLCKTPFSTHICIAYRRNYIKWIRSTSTSLTNPAFPVFPGPKLSPSSRASSDLQKHILPHTAASTATWAVHQVQLCLLSVEYNTWGDGVHKAMAPTKATLQEMDKNMWLHNKNLRSCPIVENTFWHLFWHMLGSSPWLPKNNPLPFQMQIQCQAARIN